MAVSISTQCRLPSHYCTLASLLTFLLQTRSFQKLLFDEVQYLPHPHGRGSLINLSVPCSSQPAKECCLNYSSAGLFVSRFKTVEWLPISIKLTTNASTQNSKSYIIWLQPISSVHHFLLSDSSSIFQ